MSAPPRRLSAFEGAFSLVPHGNHFNLFVPEPVQHHVPGLAVRHDELTQAATTRGTANERAPTKHVNRADDGTDGVFCGRRIHFSEEIGEALEIAKRTSGIDDAIHFRVRGSGRGRRAFLPAASASAYACTSSDA